jgi:hypothetical protein
MKDQQQSTDIILVQEEPRGPSILVEIPVTGTGQKVKLPDVQQLRSQEGQTIIIKAIRLITPKVLANAVTLSMVNAPIAELINMTLTIYSQGWLKGDTIPVLVLNDVADGDSTAATTIPYRNKATRFNNWRNVDWAQSYLLFCNGFTPTPSYAVLLEVEYIKLDAQGLVINGPS